jgi:hypothetical protein
MTTRQSKVPSKEIHLLWNRKVGRQPGKIVVPDHFSNLSFWQMPKKTINTTFFTLRKLTIGQLIMVLKLNNMFFAFALIIEGTTEEVLQCIMPLKSIYYKNVGFNEQKMYFWTLKRGLSINKYINCHYFCHENVFLVTFTELPCIGLC